ncbi:50S ribosomal protein L3 [Candidatus Falkowbacteria bacterium CG10_big_fil_rev_8_21_14_0_10_43_11]|uniref:Large ribosomal subunit protein uL3 n=1 Tax=Candidatus Falkowbacteria bacterium CG10_big_fil_rev_8_21_14_0_10_43_11 TaxID=1974568 RepID=A0A2M6WLW9_9BACT|nr:MAG: 50S ribosomal protein L3 [Candidatus Falkowbacteria bacterium CG10_big_fil_rev_8_21_14_0_10_43_11]
MKFILGKKLEMTQLFQDDGTVVPVTKIQAGPCVVTQVKNAGKDGYAAVQFGYGAKRAKNINKSLRGHADGLGNFQYLREMRVKDENKEKVELKRGQIIDVSSFILGDVVDAIGASKGLGFQGVVKRHHFHGSPGSHGHKDQLRHSGSVGAKGPAHVFKGTRMGGHMGDERVTMKNLSIAKVDADNNILYVRGAVPGARNGLVIIKGEGEMTIAESKKSEVRSEEKETEKITNDELRIKNKGEEQAAEENIEEKEQKKEEVAAI